MTNKITVYINFTPHMFLLFCQPQHVTHGLELGDGFLWITLYTFTPYNLLALICRGVIDMGHIEISINLLKQYSLLSLVNTYRNVSKYQTHENGHLEKKLRAEYCWCC